MSANLYQHLSVFVGADLWSEKGEGGGAKLFIFAGFGKRTKRQVLSNICQTQSKLLSITRAKFDKLSAKQNVFLLKL